jgi:hypothetical protein
MSNTPPHLTFPYASTVMQQHQKLVTTYSSLTARSSVVGNKGNTNENKLDERSCRNRRYSRPGCICALGATARLAWDDMVLV